MSGPDCPRCGLRSCNCETSHAQPRDCGKHRLDEVEFAGCGVCAWRAFHAERERAEKAEADSRFHKEWNELYAERERGFLATQDQLVETMKKLEAAEKRVALGERAIEAIRAEVRRHRAADLVSTAVEELRALLAEWDATLANNDATPEERR